MSLLECASVRILETLHRGVSCGADKLVAGENGELVCISRIYADENRLFFIHEQITYVYLGVLQWGSVSSKAALIR